MPAKNQPGWRPSASGIAFKTPSATNDMSTTRNPPDSEAICKPGVNTGNMSATTDQDCVTESGNPASTIKVQNMKPASIGSELQAGPKPPKMMIGPQTGTKSLHVNIGPEAGTKPSHVNIGPHTGTKPPHVNIGPHAGIKPPHVTIGPQTGSKPLQVTIGPQAGTKPPHVTIGLHTGIKPPHVTIGPQAGTKPPHVTIGPQAGTKPPHVTIGPQAETKTPHVNVQPPVINKPSTSMSIPATTKAGAHISNAVSKKYTSTLCQSKTSVNKIDPSSKQSGVSNTSRLTQSTNKIIQIKSGQNIGPPINSMNIKTGSSHTMHNLRQCNVGSKIGPPNTACRTVTITGSDKLVASGGIPSKKCMMTSSVLKLNTANSGQSISSSTNQTFKSSSTNMSLSKSISCFSSTKTTHTAAAETNRSSNKMHSNIQKMDTTFKVPTPPQTRSQFCLTGKNTQFKTPLNYTSNFTGNSGTGKNVTLHRKTAPMCECGRRSNRKFVQSPGPNMGRAFFCCPKGRRRGSGDRKSGCSFFKWEIPSPAASSNQSLFNATSNQTLLNASSASYESLFSLSGDIDYNLSGSSSVSPDIISPEYNSMAITKSRGNPLEPIPQPNFNTPVSTTNTSCGKKTLGTKLAVLVNPFKT